MHIISSFSTLEKVFQTHAHTQRPGRSCLKRVAWNCHGTSKCSETKVIQTDRSAFLLFRLPAATPLTLLSAATKQPNTPLATVAEVTDFKQSSQTFMTLTEAVKLSFLFSLQHLETIYRFLKEVIKHFEKHATYNSSDIKNTHHLVSWPSQQPKYQMANNGQENVIPHDMWYDIFKTSVHEYTLHKIQYFTDIMYSEAL